MSKMFCYQCQETAGNNGCTVKGVCGKLPAVATNLDSVKYLIKELALKANATDLDADTLSQIDEYIMNTLFKCITNANFDEKALTMTVEQGSELYNKISTEKIDFFANHAKGNALATADEDIRSARETILYGLMGMAAYHSHANNLGKTSDEVFKFTRDALAAMLDDSIDLMGYVSLIDQTGKFGVVAMALLDGANTSSFGNPEISTFALL